MKRFIVIILLCLSVSVFAKDLAFRYHTIFPNGKIPATGIKDTSGHLKSLKITGNVSISPSGTLLFDGKSGYLTIPDSSNISLQKGATLMAIVKFHNDLKGALFYRRGELLSGRNSFKQFYCNISNAKVGTPGIKVGDFQHLAIVLTPKTKGKIGIQTFVNGKAMNNLRYLPANNLVAKGAAIEFGHAPDRGPSWFFKGEVAEISMYTRPLAQAEIALDINRFLDESIIYEPLKGNTNKGKLTGTILPAGNRKSKRNHAIILNNSKLEWKTKVNGNYFAEVMIKSLSTPNKELELMKLNTNKGSWIVKLPAKSSNIVLQSCSNSTKLSYPSGSLQPQLWMGNDAMWHHLLVSQRNGKLQLAFDGFYASGELNIGSHQLNSISIGGAGNIIFSDFRLVKGKLTKQELRSRYLALYQFDDGRTGILNISDKLNKKIAELSK
jgi:hypothetical protein